MPSAEPAKEIEHCQLVLSGWEISHDADRLPNGNTLVTGTAKIAEVTSDGEIVWRLSLKGVRFGPEEAAARGFYKAERIA